MLEKIKLNQVGSCPHLNSFVAATKCVRELVAPASGLEKLDSDLLCAVYHPYPGGARPRRVLILHGFTLVTILDTLDTLPKLPARRAHSGYTGFRIDTTPARRTDARGPTRA